MDAAGRVYTPGVSRKRNRKDEGGGEGERDGQAEGKYALSRQGGWHASMADGRWTCMSLKGRTKEVVWNIPGFVASIFWNDVHEHRVKGGVVDGKDKTMGKG